MTTDTRRVLIFSRQGWLRSIVFATVTQQARQPRMIRIVMKKLRVVRTGLGRKQRFSFRRIAQMLSRGNPGDGKQRSAQ